MKRLLHALASLWPEKRGGGSPPLPDTRTGILQHGAAVLRMDKILIECVDLPIRKFAKETLGAGAPGDFVSSDGGPNVSKRDQSKYANTQIRESAAKSESATKPLLTIVILVFFMCLMAAKQVSAQAEPAAAAAIKPLEIGDAIPEELWHLPLQVVNHPEGKETITLNDYRGKLIILDFWGTYCTTCIFNMPYLHGLENTFKDDLVIVPVTREGSDRVNRFLETNSTLKPLNLLSVTQGDALFETFPSQTLPHIVLVNQDANVIAITMAEYLNKEVISDLIAGKPDVYIPRKRHSLRQPVLQIAHEYNDVKVSNNVYYSMVSGHIDGVSHNVVWEEDTIKNTRRYLVSNTYVNKMYALALESGLPLNPKRRILELKVPETVVFPSQSFRDIAIRRATFYSYEAIVPISMSKEQIRMRMKNDLDTYLELEGKIEPRVISCLALKKSDSSQLFITKGDERKRVVAGKIMSRLFDQRSEPGPLPSGIDTYLVNSSFMDVVGVLDEIVDEPLPVILNETGHDGRFDLDFPSPDEATLETVNQLLRTKGLELKWVKREMDMFVITENRFGKQPGSIRLTDIGYTSTFE